MQPSDDALQEVAWSLAHLALPDSECRVSGGYSDGCGSCASIFTALCCIRDEAVKDATEVIEAAASSGAIRWPSNALDAAIHSKVFGFLGYDPLDPNRARSESDDAE